MAKRRKKRTKKKGLAGLLPSIRLDLKLDPDRWLDMLAYGLLALASLTLLSFPSASHGAIPAWWLRTLRQAVGWGTFLIPVLLGVAGVWLLLRRFRDKLPAVTPLQVAGALSGYLALLVTLHVGASLFLHQGDLEAIGHAGQGGGRLGAAIAVPLLDGLGGAGLAVLLIVGWFIIIAVTLHMTVEDTVQAVRTLSARVWTRGRTEVAPVEEADIAAFEEPTEPEDAKEPGRPTPQPEPPVISAASVGNGDFHPHVMGSDKEHQLPPWDEILEPGNDHDVSAAVLREQARIIEETMSSLEAPVRVREINHGPVVTQFGLEPLVVETAGQQRRVKVSRITSSADDLALALEARTVRFQTPIPGKRLIGLEVPNPHAALVAMRDVLGTEAFARVASSLRLCLGQNVSGEPVVAALDRMPHLLIAGATGSGKSVCLNSIIAALLLQNTPDRLRFLMIDPKRVELTGYDGIPHLLAEVVVDAERVTHVLSWVMAEMDGRYRHFAETRATHITDYNQRVASQRGQKPLPYIVLVVDELADLMMVAPHHVERSICRIAQMARATGIHMVIATQRPSVDVVTGLIKANFPARIAFNVASSVDSRVILDMAGAEQLLSRGDMLFLPPDGPTPMRLQGTYVSDAELQRLVHYWKEEAKPRAMEPGEVVQKPLWDDMITDEPQVAYEDELLPEVIELLMEEGRASISLMQRRLRIGYTRAARLMDILEAHDVVGPQLSGGQAREVFPGAAHALLNPDDD